MVKYDFWKSDVYKIYYRWLYNVHPLNKGKHHLEGGEGSDNKILRNTCQIVVVSAGEANKVNNLVLPPSWARLGSARIQLELETFQLGSARLAGFLG